MLRSIEFGQVKGMGCVLKGGWSRSVIRAKAEGDRNEPREQLYKGHF